ncbi:MAG: mercury methylation ferredoxin HgcB [bacterium]|nr:mercury methylation ferredoxin HgcB [bacterium]
MKYLAGVSTLTYDGDKCVGCGRCVEVCPHQVFRIAEKKAVLVDKDRCIECGACAGNCEFDALAVDAGVGCAAAYINAMITGGEPSCDCSGTETGTCC